jgi:hypothetical protein
MQFNRQYRVTLYDRRFETNEGNGGRDKTESLHALRISVAPPIPQPRSLHHADACSQVLLDKI